MKKKMSQRIKRVLKQQLLWWTHTRTTINIISIVTMMIILFPYQQAGQTLGKAHFHFPFHFVFKVVRQPALQCKFWTVSVSWNLLSNQKKNNNACIFQLSQSWKKHYPMSKLSEDKSKYIVLFCENSDICLWKFFK